MAVADRGKFAEQSPGDRYGRNRGLDPSFGLFR